VEDPAAGFKKAHPEPGPNGKLESFPDGSLG